MFTAIHIEELIVISAESAEFDDVFGIEIFAIFSSDE
jgi:hypothetical protein